MTEGRNLKSEPLPQIYLIRDTDLTTFAYKLHIFPGDFLRESEFNMRSLMTNTGADAMQVYDRFFVENGYLEQVQGWGGGATTGQRRKDRTTR